MYLPKHFAQDDSAELHALMRAHPLATLVGQRADGGLSVNHVPLLFDPSDGAHGALRGHVARANPVWHELKPGSEVVAVFHGPEAYVTPSWYASKTEHGKVVPTWNYAVVHAHGTLQAIDDAQWVRSLVGELTAAHEATRQPPWGVADAPAEYVEQMLKAIVGIRIPLQRLVGKWKLGQNRPAADREGVAQGLAAEPGAQPMAALARTVAPK